MHATLLLSGLIAAGSFAIDHRGSGVFVNREELSDDTLTALARDHGVHLSRGRHWYDQRTGAWGHEGGPAAGFTHPGLRLGGELWRAASGGTTGVIVNNRELHWRDVVALQEMGIPVSRGRYWLNADGTGGFEGEPPIFNLKEIARRRRQAATIPAPRSHRQRSAFSTWDLTGVSVYR